MFENWFKKKETKDELLRAQLAKSLENYRASVNDDTDTSYTDIEVAGGTVRVAKVKAKKIEDLTEHDFEPSPTDKDLTLDDITVFK